MIPGSVVGVFAHPDDETIMVGGTLALLHQRGVQTHILSATRGEGGEFGEPPVVPDRAQLGAARAAELQAAVNALNVTSLIFLGYVDPAQTGEGDDLTLYAFTDDEDALVTQIAGYLHRLQAAVVLSHGPDGEYGHPAHKLVYRAVRRAVLEHAPHVLHYSAMAAVPGIEDHIWNASRPAQLALDITPWAAQKIAALEAHVSQHALFKRRRRLAEVREALRTTESFYREHPDAGGTSPDDPFAALLREAGARDLTAS